MSGERATDRVYAPRIYEANMEGHIIVECPECLDEMMLGEMWKELILEDGHDVPPCPDCDDDEGDSWHPDAEPKIEGAMLVAQLGDLIRDEHGEMR